MNKTFSLEQERQEDKNLRKLLKIKKVRGVLSGIILFEQEFLELKNFGLAGRQEGFVKNFQELSIAADATIFVSFFTRKARKQEL